MADKLHLLIFLLHPEEQKIKKLLQHKILTVKALAHKTTLLDFLQ